MMKFKDKMNHISPAAKRTDIALKKRRDALSEAQQCEKAATQEAPVDLHDDRLVYGSFLKRNHYQGPEEVILDISHLTKSYGKVKVLDDVSVQVKRGQIAGLIGKNGAGKSTCVESALGLKPFDSGKVSIKGIDIKEQPQKAKQLIGYSPSEPLAYDTMNAREYLGYIAAVYRMNPEVAKKRAEELMDALALPSNMRDKAFALCSHGTQQKVCLAASLIHEPDLWILDEPTVGLDIIAYRALLKIMADYADQGHAILIVTHDMELVARICDSIYVLKGEKIIPTETRNTEELSKILEEKEG